MFTYEFLIEFGDIYLQNLMLYDFGMDPKDFGNKTLLYEKIEDIEKTFDLIMFVENFQESMALLKMSICWDYEDLASLKLNAHDENSKSKLSDKATNLLKEWLNDSYILYDYFKVESV